MTELTDDIARVARLRGRDTSNYQREVVSVESAARALGPKRVRSIFFAIDNPTLDIQVYDALPLASRAFIREAAVHISALKYSELLEEVRDQSALIGLLTEVIPLRVNEVVRAKYGPDHPQATP
jgi:hypothetical protein